MRLVFSADAWADYQVWVAKGGAELARVNELIEQSLRMPFKGIGKPEPLMGDLKGWWSRRITQEHRLVYRVSGTGDSQSLEIAACRFHYTR